MIEINKRVIVDGSKGVIKYHGPVEGTNGVWVGIDWDNFHRGKHDGTYYGRRYFSTFGSSSGSFVREENLNYGTELFAEILEKYASKKQIAEDNQQDTDGGIQWEFVKMEKIYQKQKDISKLKCIVLSWSNVSYSAPATPIDFKYCTELDLTETLVGKWSQILGILSVFPALETLHLNDNRIEPLEECTHEEVQHIQNSLPLFSHISKLSLNRCRLTEHTANRLSGIFTNLEELYLAENQLGDFSSDCKNLRLLDLQGNPIMLLSHLKSISKVRSLEYLNLSSCQLNDIEFGNAQDGSSCFPNLKTLILQNNPINQWKSIERLGHLPSLSKLILRATPLSGARGVDSREMAIAKVPQITDLDRCDISPIARRSAELLFLTRFSKPPVDDQHRTTLERLKSKYKYGDEMAENVPKKKDFHMGIQSKHILLIHGERRLERTLSLALPLHKVVGLGARLLHFDPDELKGVELRRSDPNFPPEMLSRTKDNLLRQFELEDGDEIAFI